MVEYEAEQGQILVVLRRAMGENASSAVIRKRKLCSIAVSTYSTRLSIWCTCAQT